MPTRPAATTADSRGMVAWPPYVLTLYDFNTEDRPDTLDPAHFDGYPVLIRPVVPHGSDMPTAFFFWPVKRVMMKLWMITMGCLLVEKRLVDDREKANQDALLELTGRMRDIAEQWPFGDLAGAAALRANADRLESRYTIQRFFAQNRWPRTAARQNQLRTSLGFWALRELRRALIVLGMDPPLTLAQFAVGAFSFQNLPNEQGAAVDRAIAEASLERRIRDFERRIRPGAQADLMSWALHDVLAFGDDDAGRVLVDQPTQKVN